MPDRPCIVIIGGPNGAGKTTISRAVLADTLNIEHFVNADVIAQGLSGFSPDRTSFAAGRLMLRRLYELAEARESFAFESTLASRSFAPWLQKRIASGYRFHLIYVWLRSPALAVRRVRERVRRGGHDVPDPVVRRRYLRSVRNLIDLYMPLAHSWTVFDNSGSSPARLVARRPVESPTIIVNPQVWNRIGDSAHVKSRKNRGAD